MDFILQAGRTAEVSMQDQFFHVWCCHITDTKLFLVAGNLDTNSFALPKLRKSFSSSSSSVTMIVGTENPERIGGVDDTMRLPDLRLQP